MAEPHILSIEERLAPERCALIIIDMQKDFCTDGFAASKAGRPLDAAKSVIPSIQALLAGARAAGVMVCHVGFWTLPDHGSDSAPWLAQRRRATYSGDRFALAETEGAEFIDELAPLGGEAIIHKHRYSAFKGTNLDMLLSAHGIQTVVVTGVSTNVCVESTSRDAFEQDYYLFVARDCVASWDMSLHEATLKTVEARLGHAVDSAEILKLWQTRNIRKRA